MAIVIQSKDLNTYGLDSEQTLWAYCALDNTLTREINDALVPLLPDPPVTYNFALAMQGPALTMMRRGFRIDDAAVERALHGDASAVPHPELFDGDCAKAEQDARARQRGVLRRLHDLGGVVKPEKAGKKPTYNDKSLLQELARAAWGRNLNYRSPKDLKEFFYGALHIEPITSIKKGETKVSTDKEALEKIISMYPRGAVFARTILRCRELEGLIEVLQSSRDEDGRLRCSYNVAGTETGRWSSSSTCFNTGTNLQNITGSLRNIFIPDPGYVLFNVDLEQAESRAVAYLAPDPKYIHACESGDLHTTVASMVFGIPCEKKEAEKNYYRHFSYRDMAKRAGHGVNYGLTYHSLARHMHITVKEAAKFHVRYLGGEYTLSDALKLELLELPHERLGSLCVFPGAFPGIRQWHENTRIELETEGRLSTPLGRTRTFWSRLNDNSTLREAIAFRPQSMIGDLLNVALHRIWRELEGAELQILGQVHDSVVGQIREKDLDDMLPRVLGCFHNPVSVNGRTLTIPAELKIGRNWRNTKKWVPGNEIKIP